MICFQLLKHYHAETIDDAVRNEDSTFSKIEFLAAFERFRKQTFKRDTVLSAFRKTDIVSHNSSNVLISLQQRVNAHDKALDVKNYNAMFEEMKPLSDLEEPTTSIDVKKIHQFGQKILTDLSNVSELSPQLATRISKYIKDATIRIDFGAQAEEDLQHTQAAEAARASRKKTSQRRVLGGGIISVQEARTRITERADDEAMVEAQRAEKRQKRAKKVPDNATAVASMRSEQNRRQIEQIIEF